MSFEIILDGARFEWTQEEIEHFRELWNGGLNLPVNERIYLISRTMDEDPDNITLLVMDQAKKGKIDEGEVNMENRTDNLNLDRQATEVDLDRFKEQLEKNGYTVIKQKNEVNKEMIKEVIIDMILDGEIKLELKYKNS